MFFCPYSGGYPSTIATYHTLVQATLWRQADSKIIYNVQSYGK